jgi:TRAP-type C4-dicarboxylate transport system substrate-binding protein
MRSPITTVIKAAAVLGALAFAGSAQAAPEFKLRWGHYLPNTPFVQVEKDYAAAINERTGGRVEIEMTFAGGLGKGGELMTLAGRGAIDIAAVVPGYYPDQLLFWKAYQIPFIFNSPRQAMEISAESYQKLPVFREELDKFNVHFLFHQPLGSYFMTGPDGNCDNIAGLAGKKIRSFGADIPKMFEAVGAVPVSVGFGDIYEAVQRGTLDYSFINLGNINAIKVYEPGKYSCGPAMSITGHLLVIGKKTWDSLPADIRRHRQDRGRRRRGHGSCGRRDQAAEGGRTGQVACGRTRYAAGLGRCPDRGWRGRTGQRGRGLLAIEDRQLIACLEHDARRLSRWGPPRSGFPPSRTATRTAKGYLTR